MNNDTIKEEFLEALQRLYKDDYYLIRQNCCERSIVFRLGVCLNNILKNPDYDVDCEYNRIGKKPNSLIGRRLNYPDIIVHKRGDDRNNALVVEVKTPKDSNRKHLNNDKIKLEGFTSKSSYEYTYGAHVYIAATSCSVVWYEHGTIKTFCKYKVVKNKDTSERGICALQELSQHDSWKRTAFDKWYLREQGQKLTICSQD